ncbi:hypothetical protein DL240_09105 [Lujinxingia litoralis]|uniref:Uncharacterized protein n=1 Tax=Lujinxingia litoralis TaxID=2211119 RepID=A0A328C8U4_9DELT|nr:hypothetical protein [Lujinxingia litoralis]RAL23034.1 hypothetical protein DL240_09105 [Lujinxingia litoralis]
MNEDAGERDTTAAWIAFLCLSLGIGLGFWSLGVFQSGMGGAKTWAVMVLAVMALGFGGYLIRSYLRPWKMTLDEEDERKILALVSAREGRISVVELALDTKMTLRRAQNALSCLEHSGHAYITLSAHGTSYYVFPDFSPAPEGLESRDAEDFMRRLAEAQAEVEDEVEVHV